ncbi:MAG: lipid-A-disaccharide synthase N-terminal domain-containing protein [Planctomycetota bacterium]|nr:lipid-A-disaccharide synthase N-terminal domain-containing protein [Planctomycetota bacterium]
MFLGKQFLLTPWKLVGYFGAILFFARWPIQMLASRKAGKPVVPTLFWLMSIAGSVCLLSYFIFGKTDSVGIISNLFPSLVACYNLYLVVRNKKADGAGNRAAASGGGCVA